MIKKGRCNRRLIRSFISQNRYLLKKDRGSPHRSVLRGKHFSLKTIYEYLNSEYFGEKVTAAITWGEAIHETG